MGKRALLFLPLRTASLASSVRAALQLFGFLNFLLWGASLWFLFKETEWHKSRQQQQQGAPAAGAGSDSQFGQPGGAAPGQAGPPGPSNLY